jgi:hypothetical protein
MFQMSYIKSTIVQCPQFAKYRKPEIVPRKPA